MPARWWRPTRSRPACSSARPCPRRRTGSSTSAPATRPQLGSHGRLIFLADYTHSTGLKNDTEGTFLLDRPSVDTINGSIQYIAPNDHWNLTVGGTNLTNDRYLVTGQAQIAGGQIYGTYNRPVEWYARLGVKF